MKKELVYPGSRNLRRCVAKLSTAIDEEMNTLMASGKTEEQASEIVSAQLEILRKG